jgi:hypothetical protein
LAIDLAQPADIPRELLSILAEQRELMISAESIEELLKSEEIRDVVIALDLIVEKEGVVGYHYTRNFKQSIEINGLVMKSGAERRAFFLKEYGNRFTPEQLERLKDGWGNYFNSVQNQVRDNLLWFNLTKSSLRNGDAEPLLRNYGGEVVYMPFSQDRELSEILGSIGEPLVIRCNLDTGNLRTFSTHPWGNVWLSSYHLRVNSDAYQTDLDVYAGSPVLPEQIINIEVLGDDWF